MGGGAFDAASIPMAGFPETGATIFKHWNIQQEKLK
jgi:hypothetical protein